jgi:hypothetical protein
MIKTDFGGFGVGFGDPMDDAFDFTTFGVFT